MAKEHLVGSYEAKTRLPQFLDRVEHGETIVITRHGQPVAKLVSTSAEKARPDVAQAVADMLAFRDEHGPKLKGLKIRDLINEGRRQAEQRNPMSGVTERLVLDGSPTPACYFADEANPYADVVAHGLATREAIVPSLWRLEIANSLVVGERRKRSTEAQAAAFIASLEVLPIVIDEEADAQAWSETLRLARAHILSAYDAA